MKSNVRLRSNVYVRNKSLRDDADYRGKVHGREALQTLLGAIERYDSGERAQKWLTPGQLMEWQEQNRCAMCKNVVYGPVRSDASLQLEFRCPHGKCPYDK